MSERSPMPAWLDPLPDADGQRALDSWAIEQIGIAGADLMERAGGGLAFTTHGRVPEGPLAVVCGKGNNGGDGLVAARILRELGREVRVLLLGEPDELRGDAWRNLERLPGDPPEPFHPLRLDPVTGVVDAILGTGFAGSPRDPARAAIAAINGLAHQPYVVACDVPSGVDASTGEVADIAVRADVTVTFHAAKPGLWIAPGKAHAGEVVVVPIGIPEEDQPLVPDVGLITDGLLELVPRRDAAATKFSAGAVLVAGGSAGLTGAPAMAGLSAARAGAGYVTVAVPASVALVLQIKLTEIMSTALPEDDGRLAPGAVDAVLERAERVQALVLGPGLGREPETQAFAREVARRAEVPLVLDADGLNAHAGEHLAALAGRSAPTILTPHAGELARLLETESSAIGARRLHHAREAARRSGAIVVLKGDDTLVAEPEGRVAISPGGAPALATAGTGDVLSGIVAAHLAKGMEPFAAVCAAVHVHLAAGRLAAETIGPEGVIAGDVITLLPRVLAPDRD